MTPRKDPRRRRRMTRVFVPVTVLLLGAALSPFAGAATPKKPYGADVSPHTAAAGTTVPFTFALTNLAKTQMIGAANLAAPPGFTIPSGQVPTVSPRGTATVVEDTVELRDLGLMPGETATTTFMAISASDPGVYTWLLDVRQANDFRGSGNSFVPDPNNVHLKTGVGALTDPAVTTCTAGASCDGTATDGSTTADVQVDPGATPAVLTVTLFPTNIITCSDGFEGTYEGTSATVDFEVTPAIDRTKTVTITISPELVGERSAESFQVCYSSNTTFTDRFGNTITPGGAGLLPDCHPFEGPDNPPPCVLDRFLTGDPEFAQSVNVSFAAPESDPKGHI